MSLQTGVFLLECIHLLTCLKRANIWQLSISAHVLKLLLKHCHLIFHCFQLGCLLLNDHIFFVYLSENYLISPILNIQIENLLITTSLCLSNWLALWLESRNLQRSLVRIPRTNTIDIILDKHLFVIAIRSTQTLLINPAEINLSQTLRMWSTHRSGESQLRL